MKWIKRHSGHRSALVLTLFRTPPALASALVQAFSGAGLKVALNTPFGGALVPLANYRQDARVGCECRDH